MRRLLPEPAGSIDVTEAYAAALGRHPDRPWVNVCMIAALDGSVAVDGRSGGLSGATDRAVLRRLRAVADVIIVGASTARVEGYGPPSKPGQRVGVVTSSGNVDATSELFTSGRGFLVTSDDAAFEVPDGVDVVRAGTGRIDLPAAIARLATLVEGCRVIQSEGGPTLNSALLAADLVDELDLSTAPCTVGTAGTTAAGSAGTGPAGEHLHRFELAQLAVDDESYLFARWVRRR
jgi:riboflavin biosynthesis pyrimidine reductase